jgi:hypothetical protein
MDRPTRQVNTRTRGIKASTCTCARIREEEEGRNEGGKEK